MSQGLCVFSRRYCSNEVKTLQLKESAFSWTGDDFKVKVDGKTRFKIDGKAFSYRERKVLYDTKTSKAVFTAKDTVLSLHRGIKIQKGTNGKTLFTIGKKKRWIHRHESKMKTRVKDKLSGKRHKIVVKGSWRTKDAVMYVLTVVKPNQNILIFYENIVKKFSMKTLSKMNTDYSNDGYYYFFYKYAVKYVHCVFPKNENIDKNEETLSKMKNNCSG